MADSKTDKSVFANSLYDYDGSNGKWVPNYRTFDRDNHKSFAGKTMFFQNQSDTNLAKVQAVFYEKIDGSLQTVKTIDLGAIEAGKHASFTIPDEKCSYIEFAVDNNKTPRYSFYGQQDGGETDKSFTYDSAKAFCYVYQTNDSGSWATLQGGNKVYFDATFSKLKTNSANDTGGNYIDTLRQTVRPFITGAKGEGVNSVSGLMTQDSANSNLYYVELNDAYTEIAFSQKNLNNDKINATNGQSTAWETIPQTYKNPCFYADTYDDSVYGKGTRSGYWDAQGKIRDAEKGKEGSDVVDIVKSPFVRQNDVKYVNTTLYVDMQTYTIKDAYKDNKNYEITTSNEDGASKGIGQGTVDVGIYAVVETKVPAGVTGKTKPFLLSVPMTDNEGKNWLYDIDVFPKNQTSYTGIDLIKYGKTGGEITEGTLLDGFKFTLEKWNKTTERWEPITNAAKNGQDNAGDALELTTVNGKISVSSLTKGIYRFTEIDGPADGAANSDYIIDTKTHYIFEAKEDENNAGQLTIANVTEDAEANWNDGGVYNYTAVKTAEGKLAIVVDNYKPDLNKTVQKREKNTTTGEHDYVNDTDYSVGDEITYKLEVVVPENVADLKTFYVEDHPNDTKQLQYVAGSISVKASGQTASLEADTDYKFTEDETNGGFKIDFKAMNAPTVGNYKGQTLTITYKYKLLKDASLAVTGNVNKAELTYSHNAKTGTDEHENDNPHKIHDEAVVYTFATNIVKKGR